MKTLAGKLNLFSATICLLVASFALVAVSSFHSVQDESKTEVVEVDYENCEKIAQRQKRRLLKSNQPSVDPPQKILANSFCLTGLRYFRPKTERSLLNGFGGFLRT